MRRLLILVAAAALALTVGGDIAQAQYVSYSTGAQQDLTARLANKQYNIAIWGTVGGSLRGTGPPPSNGSGMRGDGCVYMYKHKGRKWDRQCGPMLVLVDPGLNWGVLVGQIDSITFAVSFIGTGTPSQGSRTGAPPRAGANGWVSRSGTAVGQVSSRVGEFTGEFSRATLGESVSLYTSYTTP